MSPEILNVLIIEDEPPAARRLGRLLQQLAPQAQIMEILDTVSSAVRWLAVNQANLIFADIHLADGNSFSIFEQVQVRTPIIFTTAYDQYAIKAFKLNSIDYLLKPIEREGLEQALHKYRDRQSPPAAPLDIQALMQAMEAQKQRPTYQKRFMVTAGEKIKSIPIEEVAYFFGQQKYVFLITHDGRQHLVDYTLTQLEDLLDPELFFRINRQFIIGYDAIQQMYAYSKSRVKVELAPTSDMEAIVSIEKAPRFKEWLNR
jgi:DNA-binding LytR/AlgR family response regulator